MNIRMSTKGKRPLRSLTPSDKIHAIQRIHDGESKASVARDIGVPESTLRGWCKNEDKLRFMSRQSAVDKISGESLPDRIDGSSSGFISGPAEKRPKLDQGPMPINFSNKLKFDELSYKRASMNGLDYSTSKALSDLSFNGLTPDYAAFNGGMKNKVFGADISRPTDPSMAAISPLSSLSHLSGLAGISQSPLAISFNELTSNLNLLAQLNPGLAAMSSLNGLAASASNLRSVKPKAQPRIPSPRADAPNEKQPGLSVKNWAKQKPPHMTSPDADYGLNLSQNSVKNKIKCPSPSLAPSLGNVPPIPILSDDPLLYWLKSQQAMLGLNSLYPPPPLDATSSPIRSSTPQQPNHQTDATIPLASTPMTPSSTPSLDEKNAAWLTWCKAFGASLNSLAPVAAAAIHTTSMPQVQNPATTAGEGEANPSNDDQKPQFENILYSHLTKDTGSPSPRSSVSLENVGTSNDANANADYQSGKPEDLSAKVIVNVNVSSSNPSSPIPIPTHSSPPTSPTKTIGTPANSPILNTKDETISRDFNNSGGSVADCKDVLDNLLYKINCNQSTPGMRNTESENDSDGSYNNDSAHNNNDICTNNNNNNSNKTDEEERSECEKRHEADDLEAIRHGEKFLKWLESCSNPRVTAVQLMQLRFLISAVKTTTNDAIRPMAKEKDCSGVTNEPSSIDVDEPMSQTEGASRCKTRRRK